MTVREAAAAIGVDVTTITRWARIGAIKANIGIGGAWIIDPIMVVNFATIKREMKTVDETAVILGVNRKTVYRRIRAQGVKTHKIGGTIYMDPKDFK